jgi:SPX domain protein involved in polyphosphate accumulation
MLEVFNFEGLAKILKKYDRKTGGLRRLPFLQKILEHPFLSTDLISELVRECENIIDETYQASEVAERVNAEVVFDGKGLLKRTIEALLTQQENVMIVEEGTSSMQNE